MKGMIVNVYRQGVWGDCTNHGVTENAKEALLVGDGVPEIFDESTDMPTLRLVRRVIQGREYLHAEPAQPPSSAHVGYMAGGNFIYSHDGRFPNPYPISVHDRTETPEQYETLSA